jgi:hypothetical protein
VFFVLSVLSSKEENEFLFQTRVGGKRELYLHMCVCLRSDAFTTRPLYPQRKSPWYPILPIIIISLSSLPSSARSFSSSLLSGPPALRNLHVSFGSSLILTSHMRFGPLNDQFPRYSLYSARAHTHTMTHLSELLIDLRT